MTTRHHRATDSPDMVLDHERSDDTGFSAFRQVLNMPVGTLAALITLCLGIGGVWLTHDRAIAAVQVTALADSERLTKLEKRDEERSKQDLEIAATLVRIETKLDVLKERIDREDRRQDRREDEQTSPKSKP